MKRKTIFILICFAYLALSIKSALNGGDFDVFLNAAIKLYNGQDIYSPPYIKGLQYFYSPLFALILIPFTGNFFVTELIWLLISGFMLYRIWILIKEYFDTSVLSSKDIFLWGIISFFFILRFLLYNIAMIQVTIFLLWAIMESLRLINNKQSISGAALLAFAINIKLMPLIVLPYLFYRSYNKELIYIVAFSFIFLFVPSVFIGHEFNTFLLTQWWSVINPANSEHMIEAGKNAQSLVGMIPVFITETQGDLPFKRNLLNLSIETTQLITNFFRLIFILFTLYFLKSPFKKNVDKYLEIRAIGYILMIVPLIFPHQQKYAFIFLFPMITYLCYYCIIMWKYNRNKWLKIYLFMLLIVSIIFSPFIGSDMIGRFYYDLIHHYRLLGIGTLLLIVFSVIAKPESIKKIIKEHNKQ